MSAATGGWSTIESDAGVFTALIEALGVRDVQFEELYSLDQETFATLPQPVYGVVFLFKYPTGPGAGAGAGAGAGSGSTAANADSAAGVAHVEREGSVKDGKYDHAASERMFFAAQVIPNACATQALLSVLLNQPSTSHHSGTGTDTATDPSQPDATAVYLGPELSAFKDFTLQFPPSLRGEALSNSEVIRGTHNSFSRAAPFADETGRTAADDDDDEVYHYVAYTRADGTLWELDGLQPAPISHGACATPADFARCVSDVLQARIARSAARGEIRFSLLAAVRDPRPAARLAGDWATVQQEDLKRRAWHWENALRRHNFLGFSAEILKAVVRQKLDAGRAQNPADPDALYRDWVAGATAETKRKLEAGRQRRQA